MEIRSSRPRVFLADNHAEFLEAAKALLRPDFEIVGTAENGAALVSEVQRLTPDVVVVDFNMPIMNGIEAVTRLESAGSPSKFVFLTIHREEELIHACLQGGKRGYVWKGRMKGHLVPAIRAVLSDHEYVSPSSGM
jgi:DNA-binding NarL/FixJ family response regulator